MPHTSTPLFKFRIILWIAVALALFFLIEPGLRDLWIRYHAEPRTVAPRGNLAQDEQATIEIFRKASPSVVYITTLERVVDPWTRNVFQVPRGTGTGFIWDSAGHVVTNYHVIEGARAAQIRLSDQHSFDAVLVGASPENDLAVLKFPVGIGGPPPLPIGTSNDLQVGQKVFAIGNPFGLDHTLTSGIISALDRTVGGDKQRVINHLIQTDAAINPGNSGGPLLDSAGRLIGVNTAIYSPSGAYSGIGFSVPVDTVNRVAPELIATGRYQRPSLGVIIDEDISKALTERMNVEGLVILKVQANSAAEQAGLQGTRLYSDGSVEPGDVIQTIEGESVASVNGLLDILSHYQVGDQVKLKVWRDGKSLEVLVTLSRERS